jgi:DNA-binding LacI/PurR family transcriptional regulator
MGDVAARAGVSKATVSRALSEAGSVSSTARERILRVVAELDYHPNHLARNMRSGSSRTFGLVISDISNPFFTAVARGAEDVAQHYGYSLAVFNTDEDPDREAKCLSLMTSDRAAGLIVASTNQVPNSFRRVTAHGIPVVGIDRRIKGLTCDLVTIDNESAAYEAITHLIALGHRRIAIIGGPAAVSSVADRVHGYERALREHRIEIDPQLIREGNLRENGGYEESVNVLALEDPPTAIFSANNLTTLGVLRALRERQVRVPTDLSIIGFDDLPIGDLLDPPVTVVEQPTHQIGAKAVELLFQRLQKPGLPVHEILMSARLIVRGSTGRPPAATSAN